MFWGIISVLLGGAYLLVLLFYLYGWFRSKGAQVPAGTAVAPVRVSVIVPARNEAANIEACIKTLAGQHAPGVWFEVIVVDDDSEDDTASRVEALAATDSRIRCLRLKTAPGETAHKKRAVEAGIALARGELIACTDADCLLPPGWLAALAKAYNGGSKKFIAAPVVYTTHPRLLSVFQTLDFMTLQGITAASVATQFHTMCNGANIAYEKQAFLDVEGFRGIDHLPTGDDMLLMYKIYRRYPQGIVYLRHRDAVVTTSEADGWRGFFNQRIRWASKAAYYDDKRIFWVLVLVYFFNVWVATLWVAGIWNGQALQWGMVLLAGKIVAEFAFLWPVAGFFHKRRWMPWFPFLQPIHILYTISAGWLGRFGSYRWKGRVIAKPPDLPQKAA